MILDYHARPPFRLIDLSLLAMLFSMLLQMPYLIVDAPLRRHATRHALMMPLEAVMARLIMLLVFATLLARAAARADADKEEACMLDGGLLITRLRVASARLFAALFTRYCAAAVYASATRVTPCRCVLPSPP